MCDYLTNRPAIILTINIIIILDDCRQSFFIVVLSLNDVDGRVTVNVKNYAKTQSRCKERRILIAENHKTWDFLLLFRVSVVKSLLLLVV